MFRGRYVGSVVSPSSLYRASPWQPSPRSRSPSRSWQSQRRLVEPDGIEPTTSCLQSTRSPSCAMAPYQKSNASYRAPCALAFACATTQQPSFKKACRAEAAEQRRLVGLGRLELPTSRLSSARSNQLSYKPLTLFLAEDQGPARAQSACANASHKR